MEISKMGYEAIEQRKSEILELLKDETLDIAKLNELDKEVDELEKREKQINKEVESRSLLLNKVATAADTDLEVKVITSSDDIKERNKMENVKYDRSSNEFRNAFYKKLMGKELTEVEERAYLHTTANTAAVIPETLENQIYTNMEEAHPILKDINILRTGTVIKIAKHTAIVAGDAKVVAEGAANEDEQNTFVDVTLAGKKFTKHVDISYELETMSIPAFEQYLIQEIGARLGAAMATDIVAQIKKDLVAANKFEAAKPGTLELEDFLKGLGQLKGTGKVYVYVNNTTLYNNLAAVKGDAGRISFIGNFQDGVAATLLGKGIKEEEAVADGEIVIVDPKQFTWNEIKGITFEQDRDIKKGVKTIAGHAIAEGSLTNDKAGVVLTVGTAA